MPSPEIRLRKVRGPECPDGRTCPAVYLEEGPSAVVRLTVRPVTDPAIIAQMGVGAGEIAVEFPLALLPEVALDA